MAKPVVTAFSWVPAFARGLVRDIRVRWALEEIGQDYEARLLAGDENKSEDYRREWQPFGQVPAYDDGEVRLFESGAILLRIAEKSGQLLGTGEQGKWDVIAWSFAILNTLELETSQLAATDIFHEGESWTEARRPQIVQMIETRLRDIADALGEREWLAGQFSIADILFHHTLTELRDTDIVERFPSLARFRERGTARPAYQRALASQLEPFEKADKEMAA